MPQSQSNGPTAPAGRNGQRATVQGGVAVPTGTCVLGGT
jgi:hypothetical protein